MSNKATYFLSNIVNGQFMVWSVCSQCMSTARIVLKDDSHVYATINKTSSSTALQRLGQDSANYLGGANLRIEIEVNWPGADIKQSISSFNITDTCARTVGRGYTFCIEDSTDSDFNDYYINIAAWDHKG